MGEYSFQGIYPDLDWGKNKTWLLKMLEQQKQHAVATENWQEELLG